LKAQTRTYRLEDTSPDAFRLLVRWLYTAQFEAPRDPDLKNFSEADEQNLAIVHLWILADKLLIPHLQNQVMRVFSKLVSQGLDEYDGQYFSTNWIPMAYERTPPDSPLRHLAVDLCLFEVWTSWRNSNQDHFPREILLDFSGAIELDHAFGNRDCDTYYSR